MSSPLRFLCVLFTAKLSIVGGGFACPHHERSGRLTSCLFTPIPFWTPFAQIEACLLPCLSAAWPVLFGPAADPPRSILLSLERWQAALASAAQIRLHPGDEAWASQTGTISSRDVVVRCGRDNLNECLRDPSRAAIDRLAARLAANLTSGARPRHGAAMHLHAFQPFPQIPKYEADGRTPVWSATAPAIAGLTYYSTNPLFRRGDVVPVPLGVRDRLLPPGAVVRGRDADEALLEWDATLRRLGRERGRDEWPARPTTLHCGGYRLKYGGGSGLGHNYGRAVAVRALRANGFTSCGDGERPDDATSASSAAAAAVAAEAPGTPAHARAASHAAHADALARSRFVAAPRGNGIATWRAWESLLVGAIPVIKRRDHGQHGDTHGALYEKLPVIVVEDWSEVTPALLEERAAAIYAAPPATYDIGVALLPHWIGEIFNSTLSALGV